jgi:hypothetical protein
MSCLELLKEADREVEPVASPIAVDRKKKKKKMSITKHSIARAGHKLSPRGV